jgi:integrase
MVEKLSEAVVKNTKAPKTGAVTIWDNEIKGFGVRIFAPSSRRPNGARSFFLNYRVDGIERRFTIGAFPEFTVKAAREKAKELRNEIAVGADPAHNKRVRREAAAMQDLMERYLREVLPRKAAAGTFRERDEIKMVNLVADLIGRARKVDEIHLGDMEQLHRVVSKESGPVRANRVLSIASKMFATALTPPAGEIKPWRDAIRGNPCKGVVRNPETEAERFFSEAEIEALLMAFDDLEALPRGEVDGGLDCLRLVMLTGCRPCEALRSRCEEFTKEPGRWVKPSAHTKQRKVHRVPLGAPARELVARLLAKRKPGQEFMFPGAEPGKHLQQVTRPWRSARARASVYLWANDPRCAKLIDDLKNALGGLPTCNEAMSHAKKIGVDLPEALRKARAYDLRHSFASLAASGGESLPIIGALLGHTQPRTTARYAHLADRPLTAAVEKVGALISGGRNGH